MVNKTADPLPKIQADYMFIRTVADHQRVAMHHVGGNTPRSSGSASCAQGGYETLTREILRHFESYGFLNPGDFAMRQRDECH